MAVKLFILLLILTSTTAWSQGKQGLMQQIEQKYGKENERLLKAMEAGDDIDVEKYSDGLKELYWQIYQSTGNGILSTAKMSPDIPAQNEVFQKYKEPLETLEYKEDEADALADKVSAHIKLLNDKVYHTNTRVFVDYLSWQREASIESSTNEDTLIITSHGYCAGAAWGYKNVFYQYFVDGCFMFGYGNVGAQVNNVTYKQSNVPTYGFKASLGASMTVSSLGAELGLKLPVLYSRQELDRPNQTRFPGYKIDEGSDFMPMVSLYSRWPVKKWFVQTEYARILRDDLSFWSVGAGYDF